MDLVIELYANCNPLSKNNFLCVEKSSQFCCATSRYETEILPKSKALLKELGIEFYVVRKTIEHI